jgi:drug/metabolite transporter (DMT)-like permease
VSESKSQPKTVDPPNAVDPPTARAAPSPRGMSQRVRVALAFAAVYVIWGSTYLAIRIAVETIPPFLMAGTRNLIAGATLFALLRASGVAAPSAREWAHAAMGGVLMLAVGNGLISWAEQLVPSNLTALLVASVPLYTALLDWWRPGGQRPQRVVFVGISIGFAGMLLLALPDRGALTAPSTVGVVAILVASLGWAVGTLVARYGRRHANGMMSSAQLMLSGGGALFLIALARGETGRFSIAAVGARGAIAFAYLVIIGSLVAFSAFGWLVGHTSPALISTTAYVNPVVAVILGWLLLGESLSPRALVGATLIIAAVMVMTLGRESLQRARQWLRERRA